MPSDLIDFPTCLSFPICSVNCQVLYRVSFHHPSPIFLISDPPFHCISLSALAQAMEMSNSNQPDIPVAYPTPPDTQPTYVAPPPIGYPTKDGYDHSKRPIPPETTSRGEGFWKGCVAALCCCWILDFCFGC